MIKKINALNLLNFPIINKDNLDSYKIGGFHPTYIGEIYEERYVATRKISISRSSTFWICKDIKFNIYVIIKIFKSSPVYTDIAHEEIEIWQKIDDYQKSGEWGDILKNWKIEDLSSNCLNYLNFFILNGPLGNHICIVLEFLGFKLLDLVYNINLNENQILKISDQILKGVLFMNKINLIHTNINLKNIMVTLSKENIEDLLKEDNKILNDYYIEKIQIIKNLLKEDTNKINELMTKKQKKQMKKRIKKKEKNKLKNKEKLDNPKNDDFNNKEILQKIISNDTILNNNKSLHANHFMKDKFIKSKSIPHLKSIKSQDKDKIIKNKIIYASSFRKINFINKLDLDNIKIKFIGFSNSINAKTSKYKLIQSFNYRSPEIFLKLCFNNRVDIWSYGCLWYRLIFNKDLFQIIDNLDINPKTQILQQMENKLGKFPKNLVSSSNIRKLYFDKNLNLLNSENPQKMDYYKFMRKKNYSEEFCIKFSKILNSSWLYEPYERSSPYDLINLKNNNNNNNNTDISSEDTSDSCSKEKIVLNCNKNIINYKYCDNNIINWKLYSYNKFYQYYKEFN